MAQTKPLRWHEKMMVLRFHPRSVFIDAAAMPWIIYFLWLHEWPLSLAVGLMAVAVRTAATSNIQAEKYAHTFLGRMALLHLYPTNAAIQIAGIVLGVVGLWQHSTIAILGAVSLLFLGHLEGWDEIWNESQNQAAEKEVA